MWQADLGRYFKLLADISDSLEALARYSLHTRAEVQDIVGDYDPDHLVRVGVLFYLEETQEYGLEPSLSRLVRERTRTRRLSSGHLAQFHVRKLVEIGDAMDRYLKKRDWDGFDVEVEELQKTLNQLDEDLKGNLDGIRKETAAFRTGPLSGVKVRLTMLKGIWERQITPLGEAFAAHGPMDDAREAVLKLLVRAEEEAPEAGRRKREYRSARFRVRQLTHSAESAHKEAYFEIRPFYEAAKRNEELARAASTLIAACFENRIEAQGLWASRRPGQSHALDKILGVQNAAGEGEDRFFSPFPQDEMVRVLVERFYGYRPAPPPILHRPKPGPRPFRIEDRVAQGALRRARENGPVQDVLAWMIETFPEASPGEIVRAYGVIALQGHEVVTNGDEVVVNRKGRIKITSHPLVGRQARKAAS